MATFTGNPGSLKPAIAAPYDQAADSWGIDVFVDATAITAAITIARTSMPAGVGLYGPANLGGVLLQAGVYMFSFRKLSTGLIFSYVELAAL